MSNNCKQSITVWFFYYNCLNFYYQRFNDIVLAWQGLPMAKLSYKGRIVQLLINCAIVTWMSVMFLKAYLHSCLPSTVLYLVFISHRLMPFCVDLAPHLSGCAVAWGESEVVSWNLCGPYCVPVGSCWCQVSDWVQNICPSNWSLIVTAWHQWRLTVGFC